MPFLEEQRVAVFVDVQNIYYSARALYQAKVDFGKVLEHTVRGRKLVRAITYVIRTDSVEMEQSFFDALEARGFDIKEKDLQIFYGGAKKGDWDVGIAMDIVRYASKMDAIVLVSGDGDFTDLMKYVKANGCRAEAAAFMESSSSMLRDEVDEFINLSEMKEEILIKNRRQRSSGNRGKAPQKSVQKQDAEKQKPRADKKVEAKPTAKKTEKPTKKKVERSRPEVPKIPKRKKRSTTKKSS